VDKMVKVCDLQHEGDVPAELSVRVVGLGPDRTLDLCAVHRQALEQLPAADRGRPVDTPAEEEPAADAGPVETANAEAAAAEVVEPAEPAVEEPAAPAPTRPSRPRRKAAQKATRSGKAAKTTKAAQPTTGARPGSRRSLQQERALVREWARQQGRDIGDKGRMPAGLVEEYQRTRGQATG
jgi:hypothetical protein